MHDGNYDTCYYWFITLSDIFKVSGCVVICISNHYPLCFWAGSAI
ncbi:hypothetical protein THOG05_10295 [Vibrio rotiferianus]|nr:hypothetical protein THOG05_10295 [Vibrio rotiferianus]